MWYCLLVTAVITQSTSCLPQYDLANKDVYEIREDRDSNTVQFVNPKPDEPVLREITYYHLIERAINGTVRTDKIVGSFGDHEHDTERPATNAHGQRFEIDMLHHDDVQVGDQIVQYHDEIVNPNSGQIEAHHDQNSDQIVANHEQWSDQGTDKKIVLHEQLSHNWYLQPLLGSTEKPSQILDQSFVQTQASEEHLEVVTTAIDPVPTQTFDKTQPYVVLTQDWFHPNSFVQEEKVIQPEVSGDVKEKKAENSQHTSNVSEYLSTENPTENVESVNPHPAEEIVETQDKTDKVTVPVEEKLEEMPLVPDRQRWYVRPSNPIAQPEATADSAVENIQVPALDILSTETESPKTVVEEIVQENPEVVHEGIPEIPAVENVHPKSPEGEVLASEVVPKEDVISVEPLPDIFDSTSESVVLGSGPNPEEVVSDPAFVATEGEIEVIEDPILTAAIIESEDANPEKPISTEEKLIEVAVGEKVIPVERQNIPETETAAETDKDTQGQTLYQTERLYNLYESPEVLQDRYMRLRRYMPNMNLREPVAAEGMAKQEQSRRRRSAMEPEENPDYIPEAPMLPPLNYDSLPDYIRTAISTEAPNDKDEEPEAEDKVKIEGNGDEVKPDVINLAQESTGLGEWEVKEELENSEGIVNMGTSKVRTYGMHLEGDHGYVWNDMFSNPGVSYKFGEDSEAEEHNEEQVPAHPEIEGHPEVEHIGDGELHKPEGHVEGLEPNHEGGTSDAEDTEDIFVNIDKEKNKQPPHYLVKPDPSGAITERKGKTTVDSEDNTVFNELINNEKFWSWISDWASTYMDLFTEKFTTDMQEEISKILSARDEEKPQIYNNSDNVEAGHTEVAPKDKNKKDSEIITLFVNGREMSRIRTSNLEGELDGDEIIDDMLKKRHDNKKGNGNSKGKEEIKVTSQAIYGNTMGNDKVTNIFIFFPENGYNKLMETLKPLLGTKDEVKPEENKEISIEENVSSISEGSAITKPEEPKPTDNIEPDIAKKPENLEEWTDANAKPIEASKVEIGPTTEAITKEDSLDPNSEAESVNFVSPSPKPEHIEANKGEIKPSTESHVAENVNADKLDKDTPEISTEPDLQSSTIPIEEVKTEAPISQETSAPILSVTEEPKTSDPILAETNSESNVYKLDEAKTETSTQSNLGTSSNPIQEEAKTEAPLSQETSAPILSVIEEPKTSDPILTESNSESNVDKLYEAKTETSTQPNVATSNNPIQEDVKTEAPITIDLNQETTAPILLVTEEPKTSGTIPPESNSGSTTAPEDISKVEGILEKTEEKSEATSEVTEPNTTSEPNIEVSIAPLEQPVKEEKIESSTELPTSESEVKVVEDISTTLAPVDSEVKENAEVNVSTSTPEIDESTKKVDKVEPAPDVTPIKDSVVKGNVEVSVTSTSTTTTPQEKPAEVASST